MAKPQIGKNFNAKRRFRPTETDASLFDQSTKPNRNMIHAEIFFQQDDGGVDVLNGGFKSTNSIYKEELTNEDTPPQRSQSRKE